MSAIATASTIVTKADRYENSPAWSTASPLAPTMPWFGGSGNAHPKIDGLRLRGGYDWLGCRAGSEGFGQMDGKRIGFLVGLIAFLLTVIVPAPAGMPGPAWTVAGLTVWMAAWWMSEAVPLTATALLPFVVLPLAKVSTADETAATYYSPILFLILGGAFLALAIERTGLHRRLALAILKGVGKGGGSTRLLLAFMIATAIISTTISNTSTALIMMPMALAVLQGGGADPDDHEGLSGALPMGIAFAASIGGLGTLIGSPTNPIAVGLLKQSIGLEISFAEWSLLRHADGDARHPAGRVDHRQGAEDRDLPLRHRGRAQVLSPPSTAWTAARKAVDAGAGRRLPAVDPAGTGAQADSCPTGSVHRRHDRRDRRPARCS